MLGATSRTLSLARLWLTALVATMLVFSGSFAAAVPGEESPSPSPLVSQVTTTVVGEDGSESSPSDEGSSPDPEEATGAATTPEPTEPIEPSEAAEPAAPSESQDPSESAEASVVVEADEDSEPERAESDADADGSAAPVPAPIPDPVDDASGADTGAGAAADTEPVEVFVPGIRVVPGPGSATVYWPDFGVDGAYVLQVEKVDGTWRTLEAEVEPAEAVEAPASADNQATLDDLKGGKDYSARIVSAATEEDARAAVEPAIGLTPGGPRGAMARARVVAAEGEDPAPVATQELAITPLAAKDATIRVFKAGIRKGFGQDQDATGLAGATFEAYRKGASTNQNLPGGTPEATCDTDVNGECDLLVDSASARYLVVEQSAPAGWSKIDQIALGRFNASGTPRPYRWNVRVNAGGLTEVPRTEIRNTTDQNWPTRDNPDGPLGVDSYRWADVKDNVLIDEDKCGLNIALIFDQSGSIGSNQSQVQNAAKQFVDDLTGTPTSLALFTFSTNSPQNNGNSQNRPTPVSIADISGANQVKGWIDGFSSAGGGTNWDEALRRVADAQQGYDLAIMLTDGNPTAWRGEKSSTSDVNDWDVEEAVHSANWLKDEGTRVISIGFSGQAGGLNSLNLELISGPQKGDPANPQTTDDYFLTTFGELGDLLSAIALNNCGGTINVQKKIAPTWNNIDLVPLEPLWPFERGASQTWVSPAAGTTGPNGAPLEFRVTFEQGQLLRDVTILEPDLQSFTPLPDPVTGLNARCSISGVGNPSTRVVNSGNGVTVQNVTDKEIVSCLFVNSPAQLEAKKYQDTNGNGTQDPGEPFLEGWDIFLDDNDNSVPDPGERLLTTDDTGTVLFSRLDAPAEYRVCEVLQDGWFNTEPGAGALCRTQLVELQGAGDPPAGPVVFGNVEAGGFTVTKSVDDAAGFVPGDTEFTIAVSCTFNGAPVDGFPKDLTLVDGETASIGPLFNGTTCTITEPDSAGAISDIQPSSVTIPADDGVKVVVDNTYPVGYGEVVKVVEGGLADELAALAPIAYTVEVSCTYPVGFPEQGAIDGYDPKVLTVEWDGTPGLAGPTVGFGPLPVGSECTIVEDPQRGATSVVISPPGTSDSGEIVIEEGTPDEAVIVTVTNTYEPVVLKIIKDIKPDGTPVPEDLVFTANVKCWTADPSGPYFDDDVPFSVADPGFVSPLLEGSTCEVTEVDARGAAWTVDPSGPFPLGDDLVEVTVTNTFETGELTVVKEVVDPSGLLTVPAQYTINVACTFDGLDLPGFPQDVVLVWTSDPSEKLTGLPYGTVCVLTEPDLTGAESVTFQPGGGDSATVTIDGTTPDVTVTATNDYPAGTFPITKQVTGPGAPFVPSVTQFEVTVTCTLPDDYPGADPAPYVVSITGGSTVTVPPAPGALPVGTTCTFEETDQQGAGSVTVQPESVTISEGEQNVEVAVANSYPVGPFTIVKQVAGGGQAFIPPGSEFTVSVTCTYPDEHPAAPGIVPGFDDLEVTITSGAVGRPGPAETVGPLPVGSECELSEEPQGEESVDFDPSDTVVVPGADEPEVDVVVVNTYPVGFAEIVKVVDGDLADELAPVGTDFLVEVRCSYPADLPGQDPAGPNPDPIPGFDPKELLIEAGVPGAEGPPVRFGPLPVGSSCTVKEIDTGGADPVQVDPPSGVPNQSAPVVIPEGAADPVTVTFTNTFNPAALVIKKEVTGPGAPLLPEEAVFKALVECTYPTSTPGTIDFREEVEFGVNDPGVVTNQPVGSTCTITETETNGAPVPPAQTVILDPPPNPVIKEITFVNEIPAGELMVSKVIDGDAAEVVPDGVSFTVGVDCKYQGTTLPGFAQELTFTTPDSLSQTLTGLPVGSECVVNESDNGGATSVEFDPAGTVPGQSDVLIVTDSAQGAVEVKVINIFDPAVLRIFKEVQPEGVLIPPGTLFTAFVQCTFEGESIYSGDVPFGVAAPGVVAGLIVGSECTITESESQGATFEPPSQTVIIEGEGEPVTVDVTITNTFVLGSLTVEKAIDDGGTGLVPTGTEYTIGVACTFAYADVPGYPTVVIVTAGGGPVDLPGPLAVGTECTLTEQELNGAQSVVFDPSDVVTISEETPDVSVVVTNVYPVGVLTVTKVIDGPGAPAVPPTTGFTVEVSCTFPVGFPAQGAIPGYSPKVVTLTGGQTETVGPLPTGSTCTVTETDTGGAKEVTITPDQPVTIGDADSSVAVTVTNTFPAPPTPPTVAGETCDPNDSGSQIPGSITIPPNPDFAYAIDGVPYGAGTYPFPAGTYTVTAQRIQAGQVSVAGVRQFALESFSWTVTVPGSEVCPGLVKSADPPSGTTVFTGDEVTYTITVSNGGDEPVVNETLVDRLPDGVELDQSSISPSDGVYDASANTITWRFDLSAAGGPTSSASFSYTVTVTQSEGTIQNSVRWVERDLTGNTEHPTEPGTTGGATDKPPTTTPPAGGLVDTGAGSTAGIGLAGLLAMLMGGLMVRFGRTRRGVQS